MKLDIGAGIKGRGCGAGLENANAPQRELGKGEAEGERKVRRWVEEER